VSSLLITSWNVLKIQTIGFYGKTSHEVNLNNVVIEKHENDVRKYHYYLITDNTSNERFIVNVDEHSKIDEKALVFLANEKCTN
jgi:purine-nucleoside phosphorylase